LEADRVVCNRGHPAPQRPFFEEEAGPIRDRRRVPLEVTVKDQPVFLCCKGCQKKALADPDKTLVAVAELKTRAKAEKDKK